MYIFYDFLRLICLHLKKENREEINVKLLVQLSNFKGGGFKSLNDDKHTNPDELL